MLVRRLGFLAAIVGLVIFLSAARPAEAGLQMQIAATGTITEGHDGMGNSVAGQSATMIQAFAIGGPLFVSPNQAFASFNQVVLAISVDGGPFAIIDSNLTAGGGAFYTISTLASGVASVSAAASILLTPFGEIQTFVSVSNYSDEIAPNTNLLQNFIFPPVPNGTVLSFGATLLNDLGDVEAYFLVERVSEISITVTQVPAPAAFGLFAAGLAGLLVVRRRRIAITTH